MKKLILATIKKNETATKWAQIVEVIKSKHDVKNFMTVRVLMQELINEGLIARLRDAHNENYILTTRKTKTTKILSASDHYVVCCKCHESKAIEETNVVGTSFMGSNLYVCDQCK